MTHLRRRRAASETHRIAAFTNLWNAHYQDLWRFCLRRCASPELAEEALNESFIVAWKRIDDMPDGADARPWLFGVAHNYVRRSWRNESQRRSLDERLRSQTIAPNIDDLAAIAPSAREGVLRALSSLRDDDQELLRLAAWEELPHAEIATILGCSVNAVAVRLHRARQRLAVELSCTTQSHNRSRPATTLPPGPKGHDNGR